MTGFFFVFFGLLNSSVCGVRIGLHFTSLAGDKRSFLSEHEPLPVTFFQCFSGAFDEFFHIAIVTLFQELPFSAVWEEV